MASYTLPLSDLVEEYAGNLYHNNLREKIENARPKLFDFDYPIFDNAYRKVFETHFIRNFYMREIGTETDALFKFNLETWLLINMPYFNQLYESEMLKYNPLINSELDVTHNKKNDKLQNDTRNGNETIGTNETNNVVQEQTGNTKGVTDSTGKQDSTMNETTAGNVSGTKVNDDFGRKINSTNPDSRLALTANDGEGVIEYASNIDEETENNKETTTGKNDGTKEGSSTVNSTDKTTSNVDSTSHSNADSVTDRDTEIDKTEKLISNINNVEDFIEHRIGKVGTQTYAEMVMKYRESFIRIEKQIFEEMQQLFMLVY